MKRSAFSSDVFLEELMGACSSKSSEASEATASETKEETETTTKEPTPLGKLKANVRRLEAEGWEGHYGVLLSTGSLNPVHWGHIQMMASAKQQLETLCADVRVVAGYLSPSHDSYVGGKFGRGRHLSGEQRADLVETALSAEALAAQSESQSDEKSSADDSYQLQMAAVLKRARHWLDCDRWEISQKYFVDFPQVSNSLVKRLAEYWEASGTPAIGSRVRVYYVCGYDHASGCDLFGGRLFKCRGVHTLIVFRPEAGYEKAHLPFGVIKTSLKRSAVLIASPVQFDRSSTAARELIASRDFPQLAKYLPIAIVNHIKDHIDEYSCF